MKCLNADEHECWACKHHATGKCDTWCDYGEAFEVRDDVREAKAFEAEPVRYGHWITFLDGEDDGIFCSECKEDLLKLFPCVDEDRLPKRCPHCGAKMRKER